MSTLSLFFNDLLELFFPRICITCGNKLMTQEHFICLGCYHDIPRTNFQNDPENKAAQIFWGRVNAGHVFSYFYFRKGSKYQKIIHFLKYKGLKELGYETGKWLGSMYSTHPGLNNFDLIVPVPLHRKKEKQRGYNQSAWIARGISDYLGKPCEAENLKRLVFTSTQTRRMRFERWKNVEGIFGVGNPGQFAGKHILLVDDVLTTGSTLESCAIELLKIPGVRVSFATLAFSEL